MGRIIDLQQFRNRAHLSKQTASSASRPQRYLPAALLACLSVRRQIGGILEVTTAIEELIERQADPRSRDELLERLWISRKEFMAAFKSLSTTIEMLSRATASSARHAPTPPEGP